MIFYYFIDQYQPFQILVIRYEKSQLITAFEGTFLSRQFGDSLVINRVSWKNFLGEVDEEMPWSAHVYWSIDYKIIENGKKSKVHVKVQLCNRSWVRQDRKCQHLLNHQQGHFLIGNLCALQFLKRVHYKKKQTHQKFDDLVCQTFDRTLKEYIELQKKYDVQTQHRLNFKQQQNWDNLFYEKLQYYKKIYDYKKNKFIKYSQINKTNLNKLIK